jgi:hypothetical protein
MAVARREREASALRATLNAVAADFAIVFVVAPEKVVV